MNEEFNPYSLEQAQDEAEKQRKKIESGEVSNYEDAETLVEIEQREERNRPEVIAWAKDMVKKIHDQANPDYVFLTDTSAIVEGFLLKETWRVAYPDQTPDFLRIDARSQTPLNQHQENVKKVEQDGRDSIYRSKVKEYFLKRIKKDHPKILVFDEASPLIGSNKIGKVFGGFGLHETSFDVRDPGSGESLKSWDAAYTMISTLTLIHDSLKQLEIEPELFTLSGGPAGVGYSNKIKERGRWDSMLSRAPTSKVFGAPSSGRPKSEDETRYTEEELERLFNKGAFNLQGRIVKHPAQRKRALAWVRRLREIGREAGEELKKEIEAEKSA